MSKRAGIVVIGNEVLSGKVTDINSTWLTSELRALGIATGRVAIIPDELDVIADHVKTFSELFDIVFTSGGVGPTHDDITMEGVAKGFGRPVERNEELADVIRSFFEQGYNESYLRMADVPAGTRLVWTEGSPFPNTVVENVWILPGDPTVLRKKFNAVKETLRVEPFHVRRLYTTIDEGDLAEMMYRIDEAWPQVQLGSYPVYDHTDYKVQLVMDSKDEAAVDAVLDALRAEIPEASIWKIERA